MLHAHIQVRYLHVTCTLHLHVTCTLREYVTCTCICYMYATACTGSKYVTFVTK